MNLHPDDGPPGNWERVEFGRGLYGLRPGDETLRGYTSWNYIHALIGMGISNPIIPVTDYGGRTYICKLSNTSPV